MDETAFFPGVKRSHDGTIIQPESSSDPSVTPNTASKEPAYSRESSPLSDLPSTLLSEAAQTPNASTSPVKKRKLTFLEREAEKAEKLAVREEKARLRAEDKARKEEEKRLRDEEKRRKAEEKDAERAKREVERAEKDAEKAEKKRAKEAEKSKKLAESVKKERSQMRIGAFFGRPVAESSPPSTPDKDLARVSSRKSSVGSLDLPPALHTKPTNTPSDFAKWILPFFPHDHTVLAPHNRFLASASAKSISEDILNGDLNASSQPLSQRFPSRRKKNTQTVPVKTLVNMISGDSQDSGQTCDEAALMLSKTPYKILHFCEDVRPPYQGTYTRPVSPRSTRKLSRKPVSRALPDTDYDYDSEAEWQAPEEGDEDLDDDDEMSEDEAEADEMADFLDDEDDTSKRKLLTADVEPVSTGLCWEGETDLDGLSLDITAYRMDVLHDSIKLPINPFSNDHWTMSGKDASVKGVSVSATQSTTMQPPRLPLATVNLPNGAVSRGTGCFQHVTAQKEKEATEVQIQKAKAKNSDKPVKMISDNLLPAFKAAVEGNDLNKVALVEILKKKFPSCSKDSIKGTLESVAVRQGKKEADKRWVLLS